MNSPTGALDFDWVSLGDERSSGFSLAGWLTGGRRSERRREEFVEPGYRRLDQRNSTHRGHGESVLLSLSHLEHFGPLPWFASGRVSTRADWGRDWADEEWELRSEIVGSPAYRSWIEQEEETRSVRRSATAAVELGYGRVRDVTGIYLARVVEARLLDAGALTRALSHETRQKLADLFVVADLYDDLRSRPGRAIWAEVERILRDDGALAAGGLDAASAARAGETLLFPLSRGRRLDGLPTALGVRYRGAHAGPLLRADHFRSTRVSNIRTRRQYWLADSLVDASDGTRGASAGDSQDEARAGFAASVYRPLGLRWQVQAETEVTAPLRRQEDGFELRTNARAAWAVADRWYAMTEWTHNRRLDQPSKGGNATADNWSTSLVASLAYEVDDHVQVSVTAYQRQERGGGTLAFQAPTQRSFERYHYVGFGLTYRFAGRFFAPGFPALSEHSSVPAIL